MATTTTTTTNSGSTININCSFYGSSVVGETTVATFQYTYSTSDGVRSTMHIDNLDVFTTNKTQILSDYQTFINDCARMTPQYTPSN